ncbi:MAG: low-specificity L-threonine aldolase [Desulfobacteraceae bacterium]|nr:MAG: low-specificity L-threonine aldolase [Desulfobacteraceae bacterium]
MKPIDLRSDTVTAPGAKMRQAMAEAVVGDDVYGEDPTVIELEALAAQTLGKPKALFCPTGTQSNLLALLTLCDRGDEYIVGQHAHTYRYEGGGAAVLGSIQPQPLDFLPDGTLDLDEVETYIKPDDFHFAKTKLLCLENTQAGKVLPMAYLEQARNFTRSHNLKLHLDGARIFNAAVKLGVGVDRIAQWFDSISFCLSKGLGAPVGSILCGDEEQISQARRWRKALGGGMRQAGILAAAGIYALNHHVERLVRDHENAAALAAGLSGIEEISINPETVQTNIVFASINKNFDGLFHHLKQKGILISYLNPCRLVTHLDVSSEEIDRVIETVKAFYST